MRDADILEVAASRALTPLEALTTSAEESDGCFCIVLDGKSEGVFGFSYSGGMGAEIWMLGTDALTREARKMVVEGRRITDDWLGHFPVLHNFVDDSNEPAKRWLQAVGFTLAAPAPYGVAGKPFRYFWKTRSV